jgi:putative tryptophan/tyrosine transport system substrate-binding protein
MISTVDPVANGLIDSLARPGANITGLARLTRDLSGKRLELLKESIPGLSQVGILWDSKAPGPVLAFKEYETAARALKIPLQSLELRGPNPDLEAAFHAATKGRSRALIAILNPVVGRHTKQIADFAIKSRLPLMFERSQDVYGGGLMSYSADDAAIFRRAAVYVDKILKGAKPSDLPVEQPTKFEFVINLKTAKALNLTIPQSVLFRADKVIK